MKAKEREIRRKKRILDHAVESGNVAKTCRYFEISHAQADSLANIVPNSDKRLPVEESKL